MTGFGILNPAALVALVAVGVLIVLHLRDRRRGIVPVGSLFLWRQLPPRAVARARFRPDTLFLLQLALLLALIAGLLHPYLEGLALPPAPGALLMVLDVSASMQTRERDGTRFDLVRRRAGELVAALGPREEVMLLAAAERPHVVLRWTADRARVRTRLETLDALDVPGALPAAIELALASARARPGMRVAVLTDQPPAAARLEAADAARLDWVQTGETDDNLALASLVVERPFFRPIREATATVVVRNHGHAARRATLAATVGDRPWIRREIAVAGAGSERVVLEDPPGDGVVVAALEVDDALAVDNRAFGWLEPEERLDVLVVSDAEEPAASLAALAATVPGSRVQTVTPARYESDAPAAALTVLDRVVPARAAAAPRALYLAPPAEGRPCRSAPAVSGASVIDWSSRHPALGGLGDLVALSFPEVRPLAAEPWAEPVVVAATPGGPVSVLVAGEHDGRRIACLGAELGSPLTSSDRVPLLLLTLGVLRWLASADGDAAIQVETGVATAIAHLESAGDETPGLRLVNDPPTLVAERAGVYRHGGRVILANFFDDEESDIGRRSAGETRATRRDPVPPAGHARREIGWWLYLLAASVLATEWAVWMRRAEA